CGVQCRRVKRIIGGDSIDIKAAPYMLSMRLNDRHICGAVIISKKWSLTAAHCCIHINPNEQFSLRSGSAKLDEGGTVHQVTQVERHNKYLDDDDDYDLCALRVHPPFEFKDAEPVKLPYPGVPLQDSWGRVTGWGYTEPDVEKLSPVLKSIDVKKVDLKHCKYAYRNSYTIHDRDICYGSGSDSKDACQGDSGGPLVNEDMVLIGVVSFGEDCGYSHLPGIYTDVVQFRNWIKNTTDV
ncbi:hypothetical protein TSAR_013217, partial [Trichomalopsis sarcophagae]